MAVGDPYEPIGFIKTPSPVMSLQWIDRQGPKASEKRKKRECCAICLFSSRLLPFVAMGRCSRLSRLEKTNSIRAKRFTSIRSTTERSSLRLSRKGSWYKRSSAHRSD